MNKRAILNHYSHIIDSLIDSTTFFPIYFQNPHELIDNYDENYGNLPHNISLCSGATRACLIDSTEDWCVKFDIEEDMIGSCSYREIDIYKQAKTRGLEQLFAEVVYIGDYTRIVHTYDFYDVEQVMGWAGYDEEYFSRKLGEVEDQLEARDITICFPLFACRRATGYNYPSLSEKERNTLRTHSTPLTERNIVVAGAFLHDWGEQLYEDLCDFCNEMHINDLHVNNAMDINGKITLIDYSGYHGSYSDETSFE